MNPLSRIILVFILVLGALSGFTQETSRQKEAEKAKEKQLKEQQKNDEKGLKMHKKIQTRKVRKMMKQSKKKALRIHQNKRDPFFTRLFKKKHRK